MAEKIRPTYQVRDTHHAPRVTPEHEKNMIKKARYSGGSVPPTMREHLPQPPKKA